jgi:hypothetical protein
MRATSPYVARSEVHLFGHEHRHKILARFVAYLSSADL